MNKLLALRFSLGWIVGYFITLSYLLLTLERGWEDDSLVALTTAANPQAIVFIPLLFAATVVLLFTDTRRRFD